MWAEVLTKPKQGRTFREFCIKLMNVPIDVPIYKTKTPPKIKHQHDKQKHQQKQQNKPVISAQGCVDANTKTSGHNTYTWPLIHLEDVLWDPNKYVVMLTQGMSRRLACLESFVK